MASLNFDLFSDFWSREYWLRCCLIKSPQNSGGCCFNLFCFCFVLFCFVLFCFFVCFVLFCFVLFCSFFYGQCISKLYSFINSVEHFKVKSNDPLQSQF